MKIRQDYSTKELKDLYDQPLMKLVSKAHHVHAQFHDPSEIQMCHCISIKTGGCPEDCKYCAQSSRYQTSVSAQPMMTFEQVIENAKKAIARGASRICLVAAWREVRDSKQFEEVLRMTEEVTNLGVEVCCCLGMIKEAQAKRLKEAGAFAYSHNLDTSEQFYKQIITTRTYQDRLDTLDVIGKAGISVCCGGILGMGESIEDRLELLRTLSSRDPHPDSVPINRLSVVPGTPLENQKPVSFWELLRIIAISRIIMPKSMVRLSSGRQHMSYEEQALCFFAGANSIHFGEKFLTVANKPMDEEEELFQLLGLQKMQANKGIKN